jgi:tight adherence protein B
VTGAVVVVCGLGFGLGAVGTVSWWRDAGSVPAPRASPPSILKRHRGDLPLAVLATVVAVGAGAVTGWPVAVPIAALGVYGVPKLFGQTSASVSIATIEAVATWTEMLQGTLAASAGLGQAIISTAPLSPPPIRAATVRLSSRLTAGMHPQEALLQFADELEDSCADRVICALQLAVSARAQRLGELLSALADSTRDEVALRLRIETSRASVRSGVRTVVVFSVLFAVALTLVAGSYLQPFGTARGQLVLLAVGGLYATGLFLMVSLTRPPVPVRLLGHQVVEA